MLEAIPVTILVGGAALACFFDLRARIIPNEITYTIIALGLLFSGLNGTLTSSMLALTAMIVFLLVLVGLAGMGAGDAKLLVGAALVLGCPQTVYLLPMIVLTGALSALVFLGLYHNPWRDVTARSSHQATYGDGAMAARSFPFAPAILISILIVVAAPWAGYPPL